MDCFLKKVFEGKAENDELCHIQFMKFSRGEFKDKAVMNFSKNKNGYAISTTAEYGNEFVRAMAEKLENNKTKVTGVIVSTRDLTGEINFSGKKQFAGVKQYIIDSEMTGNELMGLCNRFPYSFLGLSFSCNGSELKIKPKAPKSGKPSTKASDPQNVKADFCKLITNDKNLARNFIFDSEVNLDMNKKVQINNIFVVNDIILPPGEKDPAKMRELAKRKGKILRTLNIDGNIIKKESEFLA